MDATPVQITADNFVMRFVQHLPSQVRVVDHYDPVQGQPDRLIWMGENRFANTDAREGIYDLAPTRRHEGPA